jgi:hypothetical protein
MLGNLFLIYQTHTLSHNLLSADGPGETNAEREDEGYCDWAGGYACAVPPETIYIYIYIYIYI